MKRSTLLIPLLVTMMAVTGWAAPSSVPAATVNGVTVGGGFAESYSRQVVRTRKNVVYVIAADDNPCQVGDSGVIRAYKGAGAQMANPLVPTSFAEMDPTHHPMAAKRGSCLTQAGVVNMLLSPDSRLDRGGIIHVVYVQATSALVGTLYYQTFSTATDTWGARVQLATDANPNSHGGWPRTGPAAITLDANDVPHVVYIGNNVVRYTNKVSGSWSAPTTIYWSDTILHPSLVTALDGTLHLAFLDHAFATHAVVKYAKYSGAWSTVETVDSGNVLANNNDDQGPAVATDRGSLPYVLYVYGTALPPGTMDNYVRMRYRGSGGVWIDDTPSGAAGPSSARGTWYCHTPQNYISNAGDIFVFLAHDANISPGAYQYQSGGAGHNWSAVSQLDPRNATNTTAGAPGIDGSASIRFDPLRDNNPKIIDVLYYDENDGTAGYDHHATVYYKAVVLAPNQALPHRLAPPVSSTTSRRLAHN